VPVSSTPPGSSNMSCDAKAITSAIEKNISFVRPDCKISPETFVRSPRS
jgi:hypothetical protein